MSRSGYNDDGYTWQLICWRGAVTKAINGTRGQVFLKKLLAALDNLPEKKLIAEELITETGEVCAIGAVLAQENVSVERLKQLNDWIRDDCHESLAKDLSKILNIAPALAQEIQYINDEAMYGSQNPENRFAYVREWLVSQIPGQRELEEAANA